VLPGVVEEPHFDDAVQAAIGAAQPGDAVLLSPGCTSFDQFVDFAALRRPVCSAGRGISGFRALLEADEGSA